MHPRRLLAVLGVVVLTSMTSCTSFSSSRSSSMDKTGWITHCFGRFLIDLPPDAVINAGYYLWGDRIEYLDDNHDGHHLRHACRDHVDPEQTGTLIFIFGRFREFTVVTSVVHLYCEIM